MTKVAAMVLAALLSCGGPHHHHAPGYAAAKRYADWCGGKVEDPNGHHGGPYAVGCDR